MDKENKKDKQDSQKEQKKQQRKEFDFVQYGIKANGFYATFNTYKNAFKIYNDLSSATLYGIKQDGTRKELKHK